MYSYELDKYFKENEYYFNEFYDFHKVIIESPQTFYTLISSDQFTSYLRVYTTDGFEWTVRVALNNKSKL